MTISWRNNVFLGIISFLCTFLFTINNNTLQMSLFRAVIGFLIFFILGVVVQIFFDLFLPKNNEEPHSEVDNPETEPFLEKSDLEDGFQSEEENFQTVPLESLHSGLDSNKPHEF